MLDGHMLRVDLNRISIAGLLLALVAALLVLFELTTGADVRVQRLLGEGAPLARVPLAWVFALAGLIVYAIGRIVQIVTDRAGLPPRRRAPREED